MTEYAKHGGKSELGKHAVVVVKYAVPCVRAFLSEMDKGKDIQNTGKSAPTDPPSPLLDEEDIEKPRNEKNNDKENIKKVSDTSEPRKIDAPELRAKEPKERMGL